MKFRMLLIWTLLTKTFIALSSSAQNQPVHSKYSHNGLQREYIYFCPNNLKKEIPLIVVLHGYTSSAEKIMNYSKFNELAINNGFAVLYPQGTFDKDSNSFWNVGYDFHTNMTVNDVDFIIQLSEFIQDKYKHNTKNTFLTGMSNGAEMCYKIACEKPSYFKAIAPVAGMIMNSFDTSTNNSPTPVFSTFGTKDDITRFEGDTTNIDGWGGYWSTAKTIDYWCKRNNCNKVNIDTLGNSSINDSSFVIRKHFFHNSHSDDVLFYKIINGGHDWPGAWGNMDVNISEEIWRYFEKKVSNNLEH